MEHWLDLDADSLKALAARHGQPAYRAGQLRSWLHAKRVASVEAMGNLPAAWRERLGAEGRVRGFSPVAHRVAADGLTEKWSYAAGDGVAVETVLIRERRGRRRTACLSTMAGCPVGCVFCATGAGGYRRGLTRGEMLELAYRVDAACRAGPGSGDGEGAEAVVLDNSNENAAYCPASTDDGDDGDPDAEGQGIGNVVFMGMGEPLLNLDATLGAARQLADPEGLGLSGRHITFSTVGVPEGLRRLAAEKTNFRLAWSLHAATQALRDELLPGARNWPLSEVLPAVRTFAEQASRDVTVEYCLIGGVNDAAEDAETTARLLKPLRCKVNLIPLNPVAHYQGRPSGAARIRAFREILTRRGVPSTVRAEKGADIGAACGQLAGKTIGKPKSRL